MNKQDYEKIIEYCNKNNTIPLKDSNLNLGITDGGWVNVLELNSFLKTLLEEEK